MAPGDSGIKGTYWLMMLRALVIDKRMAKYRIGDAYQANKLILK